MSKNELRIEWENITGQKESVCRDQEEAAG